MRHPICVLVLPLLIVGGCDRQSKLVARTPEAMAAHVKAGEMPRHDGPAPVDLAAMPEGSISVGKVVALDRQNATVTLQHDPRSAGDWPTMRLVTKVRTPELISALKVGDQVRFHLEYRDGAPEVVALEVDPGSNSQSSRLPNGPAKP